jgi:hypothetical protein
VLLQLGNCLPESVVVQVVYQVPLDWIGLALEPVVMVMELLRASVKANVQGKLPGASVAPTHSKKL